MVGRSFGESSFAGCGLSGHSASGVRYMSILFISAGLIVTVCAPGAFVIVAVVGVMFTVDVVVANLAVVNVVVTVVGEVVVVEVVVVEVVVVVVVEVVVVEVLVVV